MPQNLTRPRAELTGLLIVAGLVIAPTVILSLVTITSLKKAQAAFEIQIRDAYARSARTVISQSMAAVGARLDDALARTRAYGEAPGPQARLALARGVPGLEAVVFLDSRWRVLNPRRAAEAPPVAPAELARALEDAAAAELRDASAAVPLYEKLIGSPGLSDHLGARAYSGLARSLANAGRTADAVSAYGKLAAMPYDRGELSLPLVARFRLWQLQPGDDSLSALLDDCLAASLDAPPEQIRFYIESVRGSLSANTSPIAAQVPAVLDARAGDERLVPAARYLVPATVLSSSAEGAPPAWKSVKVGDRRLLFTAFVLPRKDGLRGAAALFADPAALTDGIIAPFLNAQPARESVAFALSVADAPAFAPAGFEKIILEEPFPAPLEFLTLAAYSKGGAIEELARDRITLISWAFALTSLVFLMGVVSVLVWARRRASLARLQTDFVANVTHELKTPLTAIRSLAETVELNRLTAPERRDEFLSAIVLETERLSRLINNVLDFSRFERGTLRLRLEKSDISALVAEVVSSFKAALPQEESDAVRMSLPADPVWAIVDADAVTRAIWNILDNAWKYSEPPRDIHISLAAGKGRAVIAVADNGIGLKPADVRRVFRKFYRVDSSLSAETQGAGLGLSLVKAYVESHRGSVDVKSAPGKGSTFSIVLPLDTEAPQ